MGKDLIPDASSLCESGIQVHGSEREETAAEQMQSFQKSKQEPELNTIHPQLVSTSMGQAALLQKLVKRIEANEYIDFSEYPLAGKKENLSNQEAGPCGASGQSPARQKIIPDLGTRLQCFALYVVILAPSQPSRMPEMMAHRTIIAKVSQKYRWPSRVV